MNARQKLVAYMVAERLAEGWEPWSAHDVDMLVQVGGAITILDRLIKEEPTFRPARTPVPEFLNALPHAHANSSALDSAAMRRLTELQYASCKRRQEPGGPSRSPNRMRVRARALVGVDITSIGQCRADSQRGVGRPE